jgi:hypothetical protein
MAGESRSSCLGDLLRCTSEVTIVPGSFFRTGFFGSQPQSSGPLYAICVCGIFAGWEAAKQRGTTYGASS